MIVNICKRCGKEYTPSHRGEQGRKQKYCSIKCREESQKGKDHPMKDKHHTEESNKKNRLAHLGKSSKNFKGGTKKYWRQQALTRDDYTCQICGFRNMDIMIVDHKLPKCKYPELEFVLDNLQTLCPNCNQIKTIRELRNKEYHKESES